MSVLTTFTGKAATVVDGDAVTYEATTPEMEGEYVQSIGIRGDASDTITLDVASPSIPLGAMITGVMIELLQGSVTLTTNATDVTPLVVSAGAGSGVFMLAPTELDYLKIAPTVYTVGTVTVIGRA